MLVLNVSIFQDLSLALEAKMAMTIPATNLPVVNVN